jgi:hypothetical protein
MLFNQLSSNIYTCILKICCDDHLMGMGIFARRIRLRERPGYLILNNNYDFYERIFHSVYNYRIACNKSF